MSSKMNLGKMSQCSLTNLWPNALAHGSLQSVLVHNLHFAFEFCHPIIAR